MNPLPAVLPLLVRHAGTWEGEYVHVSPDGSLQDRHCFRIDVEFPADGPVHYRQTSRYRWPDGRTRDLVFEAAWSATRGRLARDDGRIHGELWQIDVDALYLVFGFRDERPWRIALVRERRADAAR